MKTYSSIILFVFVLASLMIPAQVTPAAAQGSVIYVSTAGSDTAGNGSISAPFQTIGHALTTAAAGSEIILRGAPAIANNHYKENIRIEAPNTTIRSQTGEWAVIECPVSNADITECVRLDVDSSGSTVKNVEIIGGYYYGIMLYTRWDWGEPNRSGASHILIEGAKIHDTGRDAIKITPGCDDVTIRNVEIYNTGVRDNSNAEGIDNVNGDRMIVQDSYLHDIATNGIYFKGGSTDSIVERNRLERIGEAGILMGFDTSPEYFDLAVNPNYYESIRGVVRNNMISNTQYSGIGLYAAKDAQVLNNTLINTAQTGHSPIYFGVTYQDWDPIAKRPASVNPIIQNNLVSQTSGLPDECIFIRYADDLGGLSGLNGALVMDYNLFYHAGSDCLFTDHRPGSPLETGTFAQWQSHINGDAHSLTANPQLATDGSLLAGSPAIDAGSNSKCPATDQRGAPRPQGAACDIGALEVASALVLTTMTSPASDPTQVSPIAVTVTFGASVTGFNADDITSNSGAISNFTGSGASYTFDLTPFANGLVTADIAAGVAQDSTGNVNAAAAQFSRMYAAPSVPVEVLNGGFETYINNPKIPDIWTASKFGKLDGKNSAHQEGYYSVRINGATASTKTLSQTLPFSGSAGDAFTFSFWVKGVSIPTAGICRAQILFYNNAVLNPVKPTVNCGNGKYGFKQKTKSFPAPGAYTMIVIKFTYNKTSGSVWFDAVSLAR
jgi:hypothetical protein